MLLFIMSIINDWYIYTSPEQGILILPNYDTVMWIVDEVFVWPLTTSEKAWVTRLTALAGKYIDGRALEGVFSVGF